MDKNFNEIKKRRFIAAVIKSAVCALAAGLFVAGALLLGIKLGQTSIHFAYYIVAGVCAAALAGGVAFFILKPTDKKIAAALDAEHGLKERAQTMVAFYDREGDMYELQRRDAEAKLAALPKSKPDPKKLWQYAVAAVIAVAVFVTSVALPATATGNPGPFDEPYTFTENQKAALLSLKADVEGSNLAETDKLATATALDALYTTLEQAEYQRQMKSAVLGTVSFIDGVLYTANSFDDIAYYLGATEELKELADAITEGVTFYRASSVPFFSIESVRDAEKNLETSITDKLEPKTAEFLKVYELNKADGLKDKIDGLNDALTLAVVNTQIKEDDGIAAAVKSFVEKMKKVSEQTADYEDKFLQNEIKSAVNALTDDLYDALAPQAYNCIMDEFVRQRLAQIFGLRQTELPRLKSGITELDNSLPGDKDDPDNEGGQGDEKDIYGTNENVYHPEKGEIVQYGPYHAEFRAAMLEQLDNSDLPESVREYILAYFSAMGSGLQKPDGGNTEN